MIKKSNLDKEIFCFKGLSKRLGKFIILNSILFLFLGSNPKLVYASPFIEKSEFKDDKYKEKLKKLSELRNFSGSYKINTADPDDSFLKYVNLMRSKTGETIANNEDDFLNISIDQLHEHLNDKYKIKELKNKYFNNYGRFILKTLDQDPNLEVPKRNYGLLDSEDTLEREMLEADMFEKIERIKKMGEKKILAKKNVDEEFYELMGMSKRIASEEKLFNSHQDVFGKIQDLEKGFGPFTGLGPENLEWPSENKQIKENSSALEYIHELAKEREKTERIKMLSLEAFMHAACIDTMNEENSKKANELEVENQVRAKDIDESVVENDGLIKGSHEEDEAQTMNNLGNVFELILANHTICYENLIKPCKKKESTRTELAKKAPTLLIL